MEIRLLEEKDFDQIEKIYFDSFFAERRKKELRGKEVEQDFEKLEQKDAAWFESIKRYYLPADDKHHLMWGAFDNDKLLVYVGVRTNLPGVWNDGFVFAWLKGDPTVNNMSNGALQAMWKIIYDYCEGIGKTRWYWIIEEDRHSKFNAFASRYTQFVDERYDSYTLCKIPKMSKPEIEWVWSMIGRVLPVYTDYIVRAGVLKDEFLDSKP